MRLTSNKAQGFGIKQGVSMKAKTKMNLIKILGVIVGAVFAFSMPFTFASWSQADVKTSNGVSTTGYLANQSYVVVNDTLNNPIPFGKDAYNQKVSIQYSFSYNFDVRLKYSLHWSNNADASNVILHYANRDNYIVDGAWNNSNKNFEGYVFLRDSVSAGSGTLPIFTGVEYLDKDDEAYTNQTLTINITDVVVYKSSISSGYYTSSSVLLSGITSEAGTAWLKHKQQSVGAGEAFVLVYNQRYKNELAVNHPYLNTAYKKEYSTTNGDGMLSDVTSATAVYGNRYYAGVGAYIVAGSEDILIKAVVQGTWITEQGEASHVYDNNIRYNPAENWTANSVQNDVDHTLVETFEYDYYIKANTAVYLDIVGSIEITSQGVLASSDYSGLIISTSLDLNDLTISTFTNFVTSGTISSATLAQSVSNGEYYIRPNVEILNSTTYDPALYNISSVRSQTMYGLISLTNNTNITQYANLSYALQFAISNGSSNTIVANTFTSNDWFRTEQNSLSSTLNLNGSNTLPTKIKIPAYTTLSVVKNYTVGDGTLVGEIKAYTDGSTANDAWIGLAVGVTSSSTSNSATNPGDLEIYAKKVGTSELNLYVKNNSANAISLNSLSFALNGYKYEYEDAQLGASAPSTWLGNFWSYYVLSGADHLQNTSPSFSGTYYIKSKKAAGTHGISLSTLNIGLQPNETKLLTESTYAITGATEYELILTGASYSTGTSTIKIVNEGMDSAYLSNNSNNAYYVRFSSNLNYNTQNFKTLADEKTYYIGIIRPNEAYKLDASCSILEYVVAAYDYNPSDLAGWNSEEATSFYNRIFNEID